MNDNTDNRETQEKPEDEILAQVGLALASAADVEQVIEAFVGEYPNLRDEILGLLESYRSVSSLPGSRPLFTPRARLGKYRLVREVARGGMGVVYEAEQPPTHVRRIIKTIRFSRSSAHDRRQFQEEVRILSRLKDRRIVPYVDTGVDDDCAYVVMDYVEGVTLQQVIDAAGAQQARSAGSLLPRLGDLAIGAASESRAMLSGRSASRDRRHQATDSPETGPAGQHPPALRAGKAYYRSVAHCLASMADGLHYAHKVGVVHRDVKPSNIMLETKQSADVMEQWPCILDFGLASLSETSSSTPSASTQPVSEVAGTPSHMAPEQFRGVSDVRTDIWGLGVTLYELITLRQPFSAPDIGLLQRRIEREETVPPSAFAPDVPRDLEAICLMCLAKDPNKRYSTARALAEDLQQFLNQKPTLARPLGPVRRAVRWCTRHQAVCIVVAVLALLVASLWFLAARTIAQRNAETRRATATLIRAKLEDDLMGSLPWLLDALDADGGDAARARIHQRRIAAVLQQCPELVHFWLHDGPITNAVFSPDGSRVLTTSRDATAYVRWAVRDEDSNALLLRHETPVLCGEFRPDGRRIVTGESGGSAHIWNAQTGKHILRLEHAGPVEHVCWSADGQLLVTVAAGMCSTVSLWTDQGGALVHRWELPESEAVTAVTLSPSGSLLAAGCTHGKVYVWDTARLVPAYDHEIGHAQKISSICFSPDGQRLLTTAWDEIPQIWDAVSGALLGQLQRHDFYVEHGEYSADGRWILTASCDDTARIWNATTFELAATLTDHSNTVNHASFNQDATAVVSASEDRTARAVRIEELASGRLVPKRTAQPMWHAGNVRFAAFGHGPSKDCVLTASDDGGVRIWKLAPSVLEKELLRLPIDRTRFSADCRTAVSITEDDQRAIVWRAELGIREPDLPLATPLSSVLCGPDGVRMATVSQSGRIQVWDLASGQLLAERDAAAGSLTRPIAFAPRGHLLALISERGRSGNTEVLLWEYAENQIRAVLPHEEAVKYVAFQPRGDLLLTASMDNAVRFWSVTSGRTMYTPIIHASAVIQASFSPDGKQVVTACWDDTARVYDVRTGRPTTPPLQHRGRLGCATFSHDGTLVATTGNDRTVRVWCATTGEPVTPPVALESVSGLVAFSVDDDSLSIVGNGEILHWHFAPAGNVVQLVNRARLMSAHKLDATGARTPLDHDELERLVAERRKWPAGK